MEVPQSQDQLLDATISDAVPHRVTADELLNSVEIAAGSSLHECSVGRLRGHSFSLADAACEVAQPHAVDPAPSIGTAKASQQRRAVVSVATSGRVMWPSKCSLMNASMSSSNPRRADGAISCVAEYESISFRYSAAVYAWSQSH